MIKTVRFQRKNSSKVDKKNLYNSILDTCSIVFAPKSAAKWHVFLQKLSLKLNKTLVIVVKVTWLESCALAVDVIKTCVDAHRFAAIRPQNSNFT